MRFFERFPFLDLPFFPNHGKRQLRRDFNTVILALRTSADAVRRANASAKVAQEAADRAQGYADTFNNIQ